MNPSHSFTFFSDLSNFISRLSHVNKMKDTLMYKKTIVVWWLVNVAVSGLINVIICSKAMLV